MFQLSKKYKEKLTFIAKEYGTPVYVYDLGTISAQYETLKTHFGKNVSFFYACKALTNINILKHISSMGCGCDCVSIQEVELALKAGFKLENIIFTPNCVDFEEYKKGKELNVKINIDSIPMLEQFGDTFGSSYPICIRINPHIMEGGNYNISTGHIDSKFGISIHQIRHIERIAQSTNLKIKGLHVHTGSEIKDSEVFIKGLDVVLNASLHFEDLEYVNLGSGFKVPYKKDDIYTNVEELSKKLRTRMKEFEQENKKKYKIFFEPGKFLTSSAGFFVVKTNLIKQTPATVFIGVNSGFNHLVRPMFYNSYHHIENISSTKALKRPYTVVGNICETDTFATDRMINETQEGDFLVFHNAGAYCYQMSSNFNSRFRPPEVLVDVDGGVRLIRKRDDLNSLLQNQVY